MRDHDKKRHENIEDAHRRNKNLGHFRQAFAAAEHADAEQNCQHRTDHDGCFLGIERETRKRILGVEGRQHVIAARVGQDQHDREDYAQPALAESILHIVRGAAVKTAVTVLLFVDLGKRRFNICRGAAEDGRNPHPENSPRTAEAERR